MPSTRRRQNHIFHPHVLLLEDRTLPSGANWIALGADAGGGPAVRVLDAATGAEVRSFLAYDPSFAGGVRVAVGDVNGDGIPDIITAAGPGGGPHVKVFDGRTGAVLASFMAYDPAFAGGVNVAVGDVTGDGQPDIVTGAGAGGGPHVKVFTPTGQPVTSFFAYDPGFAGGVNVAVGDVNGDRLGDVVTAPGAGGGPNVRAFNATNGALLANFMAYDPGFTGGVNVAAADLDGNGQSEIITGAGAGGGPHVEVFNGQGGLRAGFMAFAPAFTGGVRVAAVDTAGGYPNLVLGAGPGAGPICRVIDGQTFQPVADSFAFAPSFTGGLCVAGSVAQPIAVHNRDAVLEWNDIALNAIRAAKTAPPVAARALAMMHAAVYDAVNAVMPLHAFYQANPGLHPNADPSAAAAAAANRVLDNLFPGQAPAFDAALARSLAKLPDGPAEAEGVALGRQTADAILAWRANDGSTATVAYTPGTAPGQWQPTPPAFAPALLPQWPNLTPFAMTSDIQFRPAGPPALDSQQYADAVNMVQALGSANSTARTADQTQIALFWADGGGTFTPPGHWNEIAQEQSLRAGLSLAENARLFALLNIAEADAGIVAWDAKYADNVWRPITAIRNADQDGNPQTTADPTWTPLLVTPNFPSYISGHSTFSGAAAAVLSAVFGANTPFTDRGDPAQQFTRSFTSFQQAADEAGMSRIYGGIHYTFDNTDGLAAGLALGQYVVGNFLG
jgi:membrane-associated phospholipid phosphatase